jgi:prepilin signal peptidase PulO-like enzyme (type II secretory pathway)
VLDLGWHPLQLIGTVGGGFLVPFLALASFAILALVASGSLLVGVLRRYPGAGEAPITADEARGLQVGVWWFAAVSAVQTAVTAALLHWAPESVQPFALLLGSAVLGSLAGWWALYLVGLVGTVLARQYAMGFGDVKLLAPMGAFLGPAGVVYTVFVSSLIGTVVGLPCLWRKYVLRRADASTRLPYGPFLAAAALVVLACGGALHRVLWDGLARLQGLGTY